MMRFCNILSFLEAEKLKQMGYREDWQSQHFSQVYGEMGHILRHAGDTTDKDITVGSTSRYKRE